MLKQAKARVLAKAPSGKMVRRILFIWFGGTFLIGYAIGIYSFWHMIP